MKRIQLISGPRNVSTALMYSFGNRQDCAVVDEPFYAYYLHHHPEIIHPGKDDILAAQSTDFSNILADVIFKPYQQPLVFFKSMAHHFDGADWTFMKELDNILLIRRPDKLIASFIKQISHPSLLDIGLELEYQIMRYLQKEEASYVVIDSDELLDDPQTYLTSLCRRLSIPFSTGMLNWPSGPRVEDGVWAPYWYARVHQSTSFAKAENNTPNIPARLAPLLAEANKYYYAISEYKLKL